MAIGRAHVDYPLLVMTLILLVAGLLIISSASSVISEKNSGTHYYYLLHQGATALLGLVGLFVAKSTPYSIWRKLALPLLVTSLILVGIVLLPKIGVEFGGAKRWLVLGPVSVQPSEILKLSLILYLASWLDAKKNQRKGFTTAFVPFIVIMSVVGVLLVLQPDIGTLLVIGGSAVMLYFLGGGKISQLVTIVVLAAVVLLALIQIAPYRANRILVFLNPTLDPQGIGYHINQALIAIGSGGFWGRGFGQSVQKYHYLPEPTGDSVFAITAEELGFVGAFLLILLFFAFYARAMKIAERAPDFFGKLLVSGLASLIVLQAAINMAAIMNFLPLTGIPLPFVSYGGTSLFVTLFMIGIILNVSKRASIR